VELITDKPRMTSVKALDACMLLTVSKEVCVPPLPCV
jgi:hypothetical protein